MVLLLSFLACAEHRQPIEHADAGRPDGGPTAPAADQPSCERGFSPDAAQRLYAFAVQRVPKPSRCRFEGISASLSTLRLNASVPGRTAEPVLFHVTACLTHPPPGVGVITREVPRALVATCPEWQPFLDAFASEAEREAPPPPPRASTQTGAVSPPPPHASIEAASEQATQPAPTAVLPQTWPRWALGVLVSLAIVLTLLVLRRVFGWVVRPGRQAVQAVGAWWRQVGWFRWAVVVGLFALLPFEPADKRTQLLVVFPLLTFLWLVLSGAFGWAGMTRKDWPLWPVLVVGLFLREVVAVHSIQDAGPNFFADTLIGRHSFIQMALYRFWQHVGRDGQAIVLHANAVLGALAIAPFHAFVLGRTGSRRAAVAAAILFAVHPNLVRFAPTDGPYSLLLLTWFAGLALLSTAEVTSGALVAGAVLLGLAAECRLEGPLLLLSSMLLLDLKALLAVARRRWVAAALGVFCVVALVAAHYTWVISSAPERPGSFLDRWNDRPYGSWTALAGRDLGVVGELLLKIGALAGIFLRRFRLALLASIASALLLGLFNQDSAYIYLHYYLPSGALQAITVALGAEWLAERLPRLRFRPELPAIPSLALGLWLVAWNLVPWSTPNALAEEYSMLRQALAPTGAVAKRCTLLVPAVWDTVDLDLADTSFIGILPGLDVSVCTWPDCAEALERSACGYYVRRIACWASSEVPPPETQAVPRLDGACSGLEKALILSPVQERNATPSDTWNGNFQINERFPRGAVRLGVYRVDGIRAAPSRGSLAEPGAALGGGPDMVLIPGGAFSMGSAQGERDEAPMTAVSLAPYWMDRTEVTAGAYHSCVAAGQCPPGGGQCHWENDRRWQTRDVSGKEDHPVNCVSWEQARAYCEARGKRLPTEAEWEFAAGGGGRTAYPWGTMPPDDARARWNSRKGTSAVGTHPAGINAFGLADMAGNVWEWVADPYGPYPGGVVPALAQGDRKLRVFRGGGWSSNDPDGLRVTHRSAASPESQLPQLGFRCARSGGP